MIAEHVNALLLIPLSSSSIAPVVTTATNDGIVTAPFNLPLTSGKFDAYDGVNLCTQATVNATQLAKWVKGQPGGIVGLGGTAGNSGTAEEWACATKVFNAAHVQTLTLQYADWEVDNAKSVMASQLAAYPHISGIWTDGGMNCQGAEEALLAAGRPLIPCAGDDYNGILKMWVKYHEKYPDFKYVGYPQPPAEEATVALTNAIDLLEGKKGVPHMETLMPPTITEANISKYVQMTLPDAVYVFGSPLTHGELLKLFS
jgi:ABC-type sugar transport system substrate-binding protein